MERIPDAVESPINRRPFLRSVSITLATGAMAGCAGGTASNATFSATPATFVRDPNADGMRMRAVQHIVDDTIEAEGISKEVVVRSWTVTHHIDIDDTVRNEFAEIITVTTPSVRAHGEEFSPAAATPLRDLFNDIGTGVRSPEFGSDPIVTRRLTRTLPAIEWYLRVGYRGSTIRVREDFESLHGGAKTAAGSATVRFNDGDEIRASIFGRKATHAGDHILIIGWAPIHLRESTPYWPPDQPIVSDVEADRRAFMHPNACPVDCHTYLRDSID